MIAGIADCAEMLATKRGITKKEADSIMKDVVDVICDQIADKGGISFRGLFTLKKKLIKGRSGNMNGHEWKTEDSYKLSVSTGKDLLDKLN